jgi:hypothetical protein
MHYRVRHSGHDLPLRDAHRLREHQGLDVIQGPAVHTGACHSFPQSPSAMFGHCLHTDRAIPFPTSAQASLIWRYKLSRWYENVKINWGTGNACVEWIQATQETAQRCKVLSSVSFPPKKTSVAGYLLHSKMSHQLYKWTRNFASLWVTTGERHSEGLHEMWWHSQEHVHYKQSVSVKLTQTASTRLHTLPVTLITGSSNYYENTAPTPIPVAARSKA